MTINPMWFTGEGKVRRARMSALELHFLELKVDMMMKTPDSYPGIDFTYDERGGTGKILQLNFPDIKVDTTGRIVVRVTDTRDWFISPIAGVELTREEILKRFKLLVLNVGAYLHTVTNNVNSDVVVLLLPKEGMEKRGLLAYFHQGEYVIGPFYMKHKHIKEHKIGQSSDIEVRWLRKFIVGDF